MHIGYGYDSTELYPIKQDPIELFLYIVLNALISFHARNWKNYRRTKDEVHSLRWSTNLITNHHEFRLYKIIPNEFKNKAVSNKLKLFQ